MPTTIAVAPGRITSQASRIVAGEPTASRAWSTPPGTSASTAARGSSTRRVDGVRRAAGAGEGELRGVAVDRDDAPGARHPRRGDDLLADPAAADHAHALAERDPRGVAHRAEAR